MAVLVLASFGYAQVTSITDIQYVADPATDDASPLLDQTVTIEGWVTFEPMSGGGNKLWVADAAGSWNGIYVYTGDTDYNLGFGWKVTTTGTVSEYYGLTQLIADTVIVLDEAVDWAIPPAACAYTVVTAADLAGGAATAEQYEGVLVQVENVTYNSALTYGEWDVVDGSANVVAVDNPTDAVYGYVHTPAVDMAYDYIRGPLNYTYDVYKLTPEIAYDIQVTENAGAGFYTPFAWFQQVRPMDMTMRENDIGDKYTWDHSYASSARYDSSAFQDTVLVHGLVSMPTGLSYAGDGVKFIMYDFDNVAAGAEAPPWSAVLSYDPDASTFPNLFIGDEVEVTGYISEYETSPSNMTELFITEPITVLSAGNALPDPVVVTVPDMRDPLTAEQWGTVFVEFQNVIVSDDDQPYDELFMVDNDITDDIPGIIIDADSDSLDDGAISVPPMGTGIDSLWGWVYHHYGDLVDVDGDNWVYKVEPLYKEHIVIGEGPPNIISVTRSPSAPGADAAVTVTANIADNSAVASASVFYKIGTGGSFVNVAMSYISGIEWQGVIPAQAEGTNVWYYVEATDDVPTSSTKPSDTAADLFGYWATDELGIYQVQYTPFSSGTSPYNGNTVTISGVITTGAETFAAYDGYFMQSGDLAPFSGICLTIPVGVATPVVGDLVTVTGTVDDEGTEYAFKWGDNTMLVDVVECIIVSSDNDFSVYPVTTANLNADLESFESVFVELTNLEIITLNSYDWSFVDASSDTFLLDDDMIYETEVDTWFSELTVGQTIDAVRGVVTFSFGTWKIEPRGSMDIGVLGVAGDPHGMPYEFALMPVYPNPFNPTTAIQYTLPKQSPVQLIIYNSLGQMVRMLVDADQNAGHHTAFWDGLSNGGMPVGSGVYYLRLFSEGRQQVRKMVMIK